MNCTITTDSHVEYTDIKTLGVMKFTLIPTKINKTCYKFTQTKSKNVGEISLIKTTCILKTRKVAFWSSYA
jgi:hypothetical protein